MSGQEITSTPASLFCEDESGEESSRWPWVFGRLARADISTLKWWLLTRFATAIAVASGAWLLANGTDKPSGILSRWLQWDAINFDVIARFGYAGDGSRKAPYFEAFFPGFPITIRPLINLGIPPGLAGLLVSATALAVAVVALRRLGDLEFGPGVGERAALLLMISPWAVFLMAGYSEALFLGFAIPAWLAAKRGHWGLAGVLAFGASATRVTGLFLAAALIVEFALHARDRRRKWPVLLLPFASPLLYTVYQHGRTGDWGVWLTAQKLNWNRRFTLPWDAWETTWRGAFGGGQETNFIWMWRAELIGAVLAIAVLAWLLWRRRWPESVYVGGQTIALLTSSYFLSVPRVFLLWWPVWIGLGAWLKTNPAWWPYVVAVFIPLNFALAIAFTQGHWAG